MGKELKVIVAGGRDFDNYDLLCQKCDHYMKSCEPEIISGCAPGADALAIEYAKERGYQWKEFPADWKKYRKAAGPLRNREMAEYADALIAFWDGASRGTLNMIETAREKGLIIRVISYNGNVIHSSYIEKMLSKLK